MRYLLLAGSLLVFLLVAKCDREDPLQNEDFDPAERYGADVREINTPVPGKLAYFKGLDWQPFWSEDADEIETLARTVAPFEFTDQQNRSFGSKEIGTRIYVANFFFTRCPGICPKTMPNLKKVQQRFAGDRELVFVSYSITPDVDTPPVMAAFAKKMKIPADQWRLLTGAKPAIYDLARESYGADTDTGEARSQNDFIHSEHAYLVDSENRIRGIYNIKNTPYVDLLIKDITLLKKTGS